MPKLPLTPSDRALLRKHKLRVAELHGLTAAELHTRTGLPQPRARELCAHAEFQSIPSIGPRFAEDLLFLGYASLAEIRGHAGADLLEAYERRKGYRTDPCVEDQFRLVAYVAETGDRSRTWPDFTAERKAYRARYGYPADRPEASWTDR